MPPGCSVTSAIMGFPTTMVETLPGSLTSLAWSTLTATVSGAGAAKPAAGHDRIPTATAKNPKRAKARLRWELNAILYYPGTLTCRQKRYAAEPAPDGVKLTAMCEIIAKSRGKMLDNPAVCDPRALSAPMESERDSIFLF